MKKILWLSVASLAYGLAMGGPVYAARNGKERLVSHDAGAKEKPSAALASLRRAATRGDVNAEIRLGEMYARGDGVWPDRKKAAKWFGMAAAKGDPGAELAMAEMYLGGNGVPKDVNRANALFHMAVVGTSTAVKHGDSVAQERLGRMYEYGLGLKKDRKAAISWFMRAAKQGNAKAEDDLGDIYSSLIGQTPDYSMASKWYMKAAGFHDGHAEDRLATFYALGWGVNRDEKKSCFWDGRAARDGSPDGAASFGDCYVSGIDVPKNELEAVRWYRVAGQRGDAQADVVLGDIYGRSRLMDDYADLADMEKVVPRNYAEAVVWYRRAAHFGDPFAWQQLGLLYYFGNRGVQKDYKESQKWFLKAAKITMPLSEAMIGNMKYYGLGMAKDYAGGIAWMRKAIANGRPGPGQTFGEYFLAFAYVEGKGVPQDYEKAYMYWNLAAAAGFDKAAKKRDLLERLMTPAQIAAAQHMTAVWKPNK